MANTIIELKHSYSTGNVPTNLANGELAINTYDGKLFYRGGVSNTIQTIERYTGPAGLDTEVQFNDSGDLGSDSGLTYNKTNKSLTVSGSLNIGSLNVSPTLTNSYNTANAAFNKANSAAQNAFTTISVSGQSNVVANSSNDSFTLFAGAGIAITTNPESRTITIATVATSSEIWTDGSDFGEVDEEVTLEDDLGLITETATLELDLGVIVQGGVIYPDQFVLPSFSRDNLPSASPAGQLIFVPDELGGAVPAFSDGASWLRMTDRTIIG